MGTQRERPHVARVKTSAEKLQLIDIVFVILQLVAMLDRSNRNHIDQPSPLERTRFELLCPFLFRSASKKYIFVDTKRQIFLALSIDLRDIFEGSTRRERMQNCWLDYNRLNYFLRFNFVKTRQMKTDNTLCHSKNMLLF